VKKQLHESVQQSGLSLDREKGLIRGVKVLGLESQNRRRYALEAVRNALPQYEGIKVNIDHPDQPHEVRSIRDRFGKLVNVVLGDDGVRADLLFNPSHPLAEAVCWWAENQSDCLGLSHNAIGEGHDEENGVFVIDTIVEVRSVDVVADPATTRGLFEHCEKEPMNDENMIEDLPEPEPADEGYEAHIGHLVCAVLQDVNLSPEEKKKKILACLKLMDGDKPAEEAEGEEEEKDMEEGGDEGRDMENGRPREQDDEESCHECIQHLRKSKDRQVRTLVRAYDRLTSENTARKLCEAARVPATEVFLESLVRAGDEPTMKSLIEDRKAVVNRPRSSSRVPEKITDEEFLRRIKA
jgi:hypothetical protein